MGADWIWSRHNKNGGLAKMNDQFVIIWKIDWIGFRFGFRINDSKTQIFETLNFKFKNNLAKLKLISVFTHVIVSPIC